MDSLNPPVQGQFAERDDTAGLIVQKNLYGFLGLRHELSHQLAACAAGRKDFPVPVYRNDAAECILPVCEHVKQRVALSADAKRAGAVHATPV